MGRRYLYDEKENLMHTRYRYVVFAAKRVCRRVGCPRQCGQRAILFGRNNRKEPLNNNLTVLACLFSAGLCCKASPNLRVRLRFAPYPAKKILRQTKQVIV
jgi:hypothetical protein